MKRKWYLLNKWIKRERKNFYRRGADLPAEASAQAGARRVFMFIKLLIY
jgi:hypothetical protein